MKDNIILLKFQSAFVLIEQLAKFLISCSSEKGKINRLEVSINDVEPLEELGLVSDSGRYYWASRDGSFEMVGWGEASVIMPEEDIYSFSYQSIVDKLREKISVRCPRVRYYGGFKFQPLDRRGERWKSFRAYRFVVPRIELFRDGNRINLVANVVGGDMSFELKQFNDVLLCVEKWLFPNLPREHESDYYEFSNRVDCPSKREWEELVAKTLIAIDKGYFEKVVLARETTFNSSRHLDPIALIKRVVQNANNCYKFCFNPSYDRGFIGISPECLYRRTDVQMETEALAGTIPRGRNEYEDEQLKSLLLNSKKERVEHEIVVNMLKKNMEQLCSNYKYDSEPRVITLSTVHHLYTHFEGMLKPSITDGDILDVLHPTPAIGGYPRDSALEWIKKEEPLDRGIYSGPVGWISLGSAEFCVGIRSALVQGNYISLYSGAGIVQDSQPEYEWYELESKIEGYIKVLLGDNIRK